LKAHGWLRQITVPNSGPRTTADNDDDSPDQPDATDFDNADPYADADDNNDSQGGATAFQDDSTTLQLMSYNPSISSPDPPCQQYRFIDSQQEDICMQTLGLQPTSLSMFDEGYALSDVPTQTVRVTSDWNSNSGYSAPMIEQSFSAPGRMAMR
jgi:hypothetical protein